MRQSTNQLARILPKVNVINGEKERGEREKEREGGRDSKIQRYDSCSGHIKAEIGELIGDI
jgi:hypothetical protein